MHFALKGSSEGWVLDTLGPRMPAHAIQSSGLGCCSHGTFFWFQTGQMHSIVYIALLPLVSVALWKCRTRIAVGKEANVDGTVLLAHTDDAGRISSDARMVRAPAQDHLCPYHCGHTTQAIPLRPYHNGHTTMAIPLLPYHYGHTTTAIALRPCRCRHTTASILLRTYICCHAIQ